MYKYSCAAKAAAQRAAKLNPPRLGPRLSPVAVGVLSEMRVAVDLIDRGYEVFRAISSDSTCDLLIMRTGEATHRVEVRTAKRGPNGIVALRIPVRYDILALVIDKEIVYEPGLP